MFKLISNLFGGKREPSDTWRVLERMNPLLSFERFQALNLPSQQQPTVEGLIDGTLDPSQVEGVAAWAEQHGESADGVSARVYALQKTMGSEITTYFFAHGSAAPLGRFPKFVDEQTLALVFNDEVSHFQILSARELLDAHGVQNFTIERLDPAELRAEMQRRAQQFHGKTPKNEERSKLSITIERRADEDDQLEQPVDVDAIAEALVAEGADASADGVQLDEPITELGLYHVQVRMANEADAVRVSVWVVPAV